MRVDYNFPEEISKEEYGRDLLKCVQCGICSSGCEVERFDHDFSPRKIIAKALLGLREEVLGSEEIWKCAHCYICTAKCKKNIRPGDIISAIRKIAIREGYRNSNGARHVQAFLDDIWEYGKLNEATVSVRSMGMAKMLGMLPLAMMMARKGKVPHPVMRPVDGIVDVRKLYKLSGEVKK